MSKSDCMNTPKILEGNLCLLVMMEGKYVIVCSPKVKNVGQKLGTKGSLEWNRPLRSFKCSLH